MTTNYRTRKKKLSSEERRKSGDAQDSVSPHLLRKWELREQREERLMEKLNAFNKEKKEAEEEAEKAQADVVIDQAKEMQEEASKKTDK